MVRKREDGRWEGRIVIGHKQNGDSIFRHVYTKTQKELLDKLHRNIEDYHDVDLTEDSRMTLGNGWTASSASTRRTRFGPALCGATKPWSNNISNPSWAISRCRSSAPRTFSGCTAG